MRSWRSESGPASIVPIDARPAPFIGFAALELIGAPLFIYRQSRVAAADLQH
jgi:hypothetical protein